MEKKFNNNEEINYILQQYDLKLYSHMVYNVQI